MISNACIILPLDSILHKTQPFVTKLYEQVSPYRSGKCCRAHVQVSEYPPLFKNSLKKQSFSEFE